MKKVLFLLVALMLLCSCNSGNGKRTENSNEASQSEAKVDAETEIEDQQDVCDGAEYVDLGLSVNWATYNVGAYTPESYGDYFAWGEHSTKGSFTEDNCTSYYHSCMDISGDIDYDAATLICGEDWRIPTVAEFEELVSNCTWTREKLNGVDGYKVTGPNGNSIFLPAAGWRNDVNEINTSTHGSYWTSTRDDYDLNYTYYMSFDETEYRITTHKLHHGRSIRPVFSK